MVAALKHEETPAEVEVAPDLGYPDAATMRAEFEAQLRERGDSSEEAARKGAQYQQGIEHALKHIGDRPATPRPEWIDIAPRDLPEKLRAGEFNGLSKPELDYLLAVSAGDRDRAAGLWKAACDGHAARQPAAVARADLKRLAERARVDAAETLRSQLRKKGRDAMAVLALNSALMAFDQADSEAMEAGAMHFEDVFEGPLYGKGLAYEVEEARHRLGRIPAKVRRVLAKNPRTQRAVRFIELRLATEAADDLFLERDALQQALDALPFMRLQKPYRKQWCRVLDRQGPAHTKLKQALKAYAAANKRAEFAPGHADPLHGHVQHCHRICARASILAAAFKY